MHPIKNLNSEFILMGFFISEAPERNTEAHLDQETD